MPAARGPSFLFKIRCWLKYSQIWREVLGVVIRYGAAHLLPSSRVGVCSRLIIFVF